MVHQTSLAFNFAVFEKSRHHNPSHRLPIPTTAHTAQVRSYVSTQPHTIVGWVASVSVWVWPRQISFSLPQPHPPSVYLFDIKKLGITFSPLLPPFPVLSLGSEGRKRERERERKRKRKRKESQDKLFSLSLLLLPPFPFPPTVNFLLSLFLSLTIKLRQSTNSPFCPFCIIFDDFLFLFCPTFPLLYLPNIIHWNSESQGKVGSRLFVSDPICVSLSLSLSLGFTVHPSDWWLRGWCPLATATAVESTIKCEIGHYVVAIFHPQPFFNFFQNSGNAAYVAHLNIKILCTQKVSQKREKKQVLK